MSQSLPVPKINRIAEFDDVVLEREYYSLNINSMKKSYAVIVVAVGVLFLGLLALDLLFGKYNVVFLNILPPLAGFFASLTMARQFRRDADARRLSFLMMLYETVLVFCCQAILMSFTEQVFVEQAMAFLLILFASFLFNHRWVHNLLFCAAVMMGFLTVAALRFGGAALLGQLNIVVFMVLGVLIAAFNSYNLNVNRRRHYFRERQLEVLSITDRLTGIYNRQKIGDVFEEWTAGTQTGRFSVIMYDLDNFKYVNDTFGHLMGDRVLIECTHIVRGAIRDQDIFARWGGEEFMILLPDTGLEAAIEVAERLRNTIEALTFEQEMRITASFGVSRYQEQDTLDTLTLRADRLLYEAKAQGKNRVCSDLTLLGGQNSAFISIS